MTLSLVTGGSGFIGQHLVERLVRNGERVRVLDLELPMKRHADVDYIQGSVTETKVVREAMDGVDHVFHTAAIPHLWIPDPALYHETNVVGTRIVFDEALRAGIKRVVHTSSAMVLIDEDTGRRAATLDESHQTSENKLIGHYARSKWRAEKQALSYADRLPVVVVMPTLPLGPGDHHLTPPSRMLRDFVDSRTLAYADCILNIIDVRDVAAGHDLACRHGRSGQRYILNCHSLPMLSFLRRLEKLTHCRMPTWKVPGALALVASASMELWANVKSGTSPIAPLAGVRTGLRPVTFDARLAEKELNLPTTSLDDTLKDAVVWFAHAGHLSPEFPRTTLAFGDR